jgi:hypothetical protein
LGRCKAFWAPPMTIDKWQLTNDKFPVSEQRFT